MNKMTFVRGQGGIPKTLPGEDHISGILTYCSDSELPEGFTGTDRIKLVGSLESAEESGIRSDVASWTIKALHYHISEAFRINPGLELYIAICRTPSDTYNYNELKAMQNFADGRIRQAAVYAPGKPLSAEDVTALQGVATQLNEQFMPMSILFAPNITGATDLTGMSGIGNSNVSVLIGQDGGGVAGALYADPQKVGSVNMAGLAIGALSKASVHESIAWVQKFPMGVDLPALADGELIKNIDKAVLEELDKKRFIFMIKQVGLTGAYFNDSHTMDVATSDYAYIEAQRTMDKAIRGIRTYLLPHLSSPIYVDPHTGKIDPGTSKFLELVASTAIEAMEASGEISGYKVEIDPDQNVLATSEVEFVIKKVQVGIMRKIKVKIGYTTKL